MAERSPRNLGGDLLVLGAQVAAAIAVPLLLAAFAGNALDQALGTTPWGLLVLILLGLGVAGGGMYAIIRSFAARNPVVAPSDAARDAGRRWEADIAEKERRREAGEED